MGYSAPRHNQQARIGLGHDRTTNLAMKRQTITKQDVGKRVLNTDGSAVGRIVAVENGTGYVLPDPGLLDTIKAKIGWMARTEHAHPLDDGSIQTITEDAVHLRGTL